MASEATALLQSTNVAYYYYYYYYYYYHHHHHHRPIAADNICYNNSLDSRWAHTLYN